MITIPIWHIGITFFWIIWPRHTFLIRQLQSKIDSNQLNNCPKGLFVTQKIDKNFSKTKQMFTKYNLRPRKPKNYSLERPTQKIDYNLIPHKPKN